MTAHDDRLALLHRRAAELAQPPTEEDMTPAIDLLEVTIAGRRVALESRAVLQVLPNQGLCRLPQECGAMLGLVAARGTTVPVADLGALLGDSDPTQKREYVVLVDDPAPVGLLVDTVAAIKLVHTRDIRRPSTQSPASDVEAGMTPDGVVVLDTDVLLADPRLNPGADAQNLSVPRSAPQK